MANTISAIALVTSAVTSLASASYSVYSGYRQREKAEKLEEQADREAALARKKAEFDEAQARLRLRRLMGTQRSLYAKAGVDLSAGSPLITLAATEEEGLQELELLRMGGRAAVAGKLSEAQMAREEGQTALTGGYLEGTSTLLSGLGKALPAYEEWRKKKQPYRG